MSEERTTGHFEGVDFEGFWDEGEYSKENYTEPPPSDELIAEVEAELGYRLPDSYVELARMPGGRNGGMVERPHYPVDGPPDAIEIVTVSGFFAIGRTARYSLLGDIGSPFMISEWGYPEIGVGIADTPSAGHELIMLDYRECGPQGEPSVAHVDQEGDYRITTIAPDFATFVRGLITEEEAYEGEEEARFEADLLRVQRGTLSPILRRALDAAAAELADGEALIRALAERIVRDKGHFSLHADPDSWLMYDTVFWLYSQLQTATSFEDYFESAQDQHDYARPCHVLMLRMDFVSDPYGFRTGGYAEGFVRGWWDARIESGAIVAVEDGYRFTDEQAARTLRELRAVGAGA